MNGKENFERLKQDFVAYLQEQSIERLRAVARRVGVERATTKKKGALVEEIVAVEEGLIPVAPESNRGAPVKNDFVDPKILAKIEEYRLAFYASQYEEDVRVRPAFSKPHADHIFSFHSDEESAEGVFDTDVYVGQLTSYRGAYCLFPLDGNYAAQGDDLVVVPLSVVEGRSLLEGDIVSCSIERRGKVRLLKRVLSVGGRISNFEKFSFDTEQTTYPEEKLRLSEYGRANLASKVLDLFAPCGFGERVLIAADGRKGQNDFIMSLISAMYKRTDLRLIVLSLSASPERAAKLREALNDDQIVTATFDQGAEHAVFAAEFALARAKRLVERHQKVCLIVDSFNSLARAYNASEKSDGGKTLACGLESKSLQFLKDYLGSARNFAERSSSLTVIGGLSIEGDDGADEMIRQELSDVATAYVKLTKDPTEITPAVDFLACRTDEKFQLLTEEERAFVLWCLSTELPRLGVKKFSEKLGANESVGTTVSAMRAENQ